MLQNLTALHVACSKTIVDQLLRYGACISAVDALVSYLCSACKINQRAVSVIAPASHMHVYHSSMVVWGRCPADQDSFPNNDLLRGAWGHAHIDAHRQDQLAADHFRSSSSVL